MALPHFRCEFRNEMKMVAGQCKKELAIRPNCQEGGRYEKRSLASDLLPWLREPDSNRRPLGYEPNELPLLHPAMFVSAKVRIIIEKTNISSLKFILLLDLLFSCLIYNELLQC